MNHENQNLFFWWFNLGLYRGKKFQSWYLIYIYIHTMIFDICIYIYAIYICTYTYYEHKILPASSVLLRIFCCRFEEPLLSEASPSTLCPELSQLSP
jgi:hypothetical protein